MEKVVLAMIGLGGRGRGDLLDTLADMKDVHVAVICDKNPATFEPANALLEKKAGYRAETTTEADEVFARADVQGVVIATSWNSHVPLAIAAMRAGKYAAFEVGPAQNLQMCWDLIRAHEETGVPCMMMENCDYGEKELALLRMIREGVFGEITYVSGGYHHDLRGMVKDLKCLDGGGRERAWQNLRRCGDLYPDHELGPIMNYLNINRGNRMVSLTTMATKARGLTAAYRQTEEGKDDPREFKMGDVVTTMIQCANGEVIVLQHDTCTPQPYSRGGRVQGTKGIWNADMHSIHLEGITAQDKWDSDEPYLLKYRHPFWNDKQKYLDLEYHHGGMDMMLLRSFVHSIRHGENTVIDAYDSATMLAVPVLTEESIQHGSAPVAIPDFTAGRWIDRPLAPPSMFSLDAFYPECFPDGWTIE